jgi:hypothetical protein
MSPFWRWKFFTLFSAALIRVRRSLKKFDLKCGANSGAALKRVNTVSDKLDYVQWYFYHCTN